jgi:hypothetical protein
METGIRLVLAAALLIEMVIGNAIGGDRQIDRSERSGQLQEMIQTAWRSSGSGPAHKSRADILREWLGPLEAVAVLSSVRAMDFGRYPVSETLVKTTVESELKRRKIPVLSHRSNVISDPRLPDPCKLATLWVEIHGRVHSDGRTASVFILMKLKQEVALVAAEAPTFAHADTWQSATFLIGTPRDIRERYPKELRALANSFADDWATAHRGQVSKGARPANGPATPSRLRSQADR